MPAFEADDVDGGTIGSGAGSVIRMWFPKGSRSSTSPQDWQRSDRPSHFQPPLEIAGKRVEQSIVSLISHPHLLKRLREEHLLTHWSQWKEGLGPGGFGQQAKTRKD